MTGNETSSGSKSTSLTGIRQYAPGVNSPLLTILDNSGLFGLFGFSGLSGLSGLSG